MAAVLLYLRWQKFSNQFKTNTELQWYSLFFSSRNFISHFLLWEHCSCKAGNTAICYAILHVSTNYSPSSGFGRHLPLLQAWGEIRLIEGNAKCRHLKKWLVKGLCGKCLSVWGPEPHPPPPPHTHCIRVHSILIHTRQGGRGRVKSKRRLEGQQFTRLGRKY
jgi:hypothetical protein